ncbi:enolase C-terminal domain-like protein [Petroclostridium sp. X23]|uniref:enolase C-terminal domain-like protein n=1 Tax=Petroclostridium sp. X23 TaxID=3045146 RepID=UPI0024AD494C|nr:enolase C-terminal domain-like protein [Petroclostridium sp. X23]WHH60119.1 enolase C-terminal domain-like protein [Petroclostridium sp. X23]
MKIVDIKYCDMRFSGNVRNSVIDFSQMTTTAVAIVTDIIRDGKPIIGWGFNSAGRYGQSGIISSRLAPRIMKAEAAELLSDEGTNFSPDKIFKVMMKNEKPGGHGDRAHAVGAIDMAVWDLVSKIEEKPLWKYLSETYGDGTYSDKVFCYAAGGYYSDESFSEEKRLQILKNEMKSYLDEGFTTVKMKVGGASLAEDMKRLEAVISVSGNGSVTSVDANGKFDLKTALAYAETMKPYNIMWFEEPGDPNDYLLHAVLADQYSCPIAIGENLFSEQDIKNMILYGHLRSQIDYLQMDANLAYGATGFIKIMKVIKEMGWDAQRIYPHGGNLLCLHLSAAFKLGGSECYPGVFQPFGGFGDSTRIENGYASLPMECGIGIEQKQSLYQVMKQLMI